MCLANLTDRLDTGTAPRLVDADVTSVEQRYSAQVTDG
jgi:hypothetical protein